MDDEPPSARPVGELAAETAIHALGGKSQRIVALGQPSTSSSRRSKHRRTDLVESLSGRDCCYGNLAVACVFYRATRHRIDVDNMLKDVLDAGTAARWWVDDQQVTFLLGVLEHDPENPRTVIFVTDHKSTMDRRPGAEPRFCERCGNLFKSPHLPARFCSRRCRAIHAARGNDLSVLIPCANCGTPFRRHTSTNKCCSAACAREVLIGKNKAHARALASCTDCGTTLSKPGYGTCRACWLRQQAELDRRCSLPSCSAPHYARGLCNAHYQSWRRNGKPIEEFQEPPAGPGRLV